jgi:hypothetical protein
MSDSLRSVQNRARELARSGKFVGWRPIAFELRFEPGYSEASAWINSLSTQDEIDALCIEARAANRRSNPEAA